MREVDPSAVCCLRMFGMVLEKIIIPDVQKVSGPVEKKICAVGITKILTECPAMMDTEYTKLWLETGPTKHIPCTCCALLPQTSTRTWIVLDR